MKTKNRFRITLIIISISSLFITNCKKEEAIVPFLNIQTNDVDVVLKNSAVCGGTITSYGGKTITKTGVCWSLNQNTSTANSTTSNSLENNSFTSKIEGLIPNTKYYIRAYATYSDGTAYGKELSFTTTESNIFFNPNISYGTMNDNDGNIYKTVTIGTQTWMAENLRTTTYNDGTPIPNVTDKDIWLGMKTGAYCYHNNTTDVDSILTFGSLYNWYTVNTGKLAPIGWHIPTKDEFEELISCFEDNFTAAYKLKEASTTHWNVSYGSLAYNESGFTALPGGFRGTEDYLSIGYMGSFWCSTENIDHNDAGCNYSFYDGSNNIEDGSFYKYAGISVRCIKD